MKQSTNMSSKPQVSSGIRKRIIAARPLSSSTKKTESSKAGYISLIIFIAKY